MARVAGLPGMFIYRANDKNEKRTNKRAQRREGT